MAVFFRKLHYLVHCSRIRIMFLLADTSTWRLLLLFFLKYDSNINTRLCSCYYWFFSSQNGYYYGVYDAGDLLQALSTKDSNIYSNFHHYKVQYIAQDPRIPNVKIFPKVRTFKVIYPERFVRFPLDDTFMRSE